MTQFFNFLEFGMFIIVFLIGVYMITKFKKGGLTTPPVLSGISFILIACIFAMNNFGVILYYFA